VAEAVKAVGVLRWAEKTKVAMVQECQCLDPFPNTLSYEVPHSLDDLCLLQEWCFPDRPISDDDY
jgi:hypothetical protein